MRVPRNMHMGTIRMVGRLGPAIVRMAMRNRCPSKEQLNDHQNRNHKSHAHITPVTIVRRKWTFGNAFSTIEARSAKRGW
ncbi:MAG: hypothetical protein B7Z55_01210 [Planctomycetales bacterium 12-60-4]|nr:MAG: hypothetical protein B7Z55_01210 [Planctomycetales bacterium 12-60-4]